jgi:glycosyltransferase involved in cell wall biosynthesis
MISIIIPIYNQANKLLATISALEVQTYQDFEIIIVNDGSTDNFAKVSQKIDIPVKIINQDHKGAPTARNLGFQNSSGEYVLFCDADAVLNFRALEKMMSALHDHPDCAYAYAGFKFGWKTFRLWPFDAERLRRMPYIHTMSLIRRSAFPAGGWDESLKKLQDWDLFLTILEQGGRGYFINEILFYVKSGGQISAWLPGLAYKLLPFLGSVKKYQEAMRIVKEKHKL